VAENDSWPRDEATTWAEAPCSRARVECTPPGAARGRRSKKV
jgi:hypothetical protein